jgi:hypothetical protein
MTHTLTTRRGVLSGAAATSALIASGSFKAHAADTVIGFGRPDCEIGRRKDVTKPGMSSRRWRNAGRRIKSEMSRCAHAFSSLFAQHRRSPELVR